MNKTPMTVGGAALAIMLAVAGSEAGPRKQGTRDFNPTPEMIQRFDFDKDGKLNADERSAAMADWNKQFDTNNDGKLDTAEKEGIRAQRREMKLVKRFDANGDGKLEGDEVVLAGEAKKTAEAKKAEFLAKFDADKNGKIEGAERDAVLKQKMEKQLLHRFDINNNGTLEGTEATVAETARQQMLAKHTEWLKKSDSNSDGVVDELERKAARKAWKAEHPKKEFRKGARKERRFK